MLSRTLSHVRRRLILRKVSGFLPVAIPLFNEANSSRGQPWPFIFLSLCAVTLISLAEPENEQVVLSPSNHIDLIKYAISGQSFTTNKKRMDYFLNMNYTLSTEEVQFLMAAYAYGDGNRKRFQVLYPGVERVELNKVNQMVGETFIQPHCSDFARQYRHIIVNVEDEELKEQFYKIFSLKFDTKEEFKNFSAHKGDVSIVQNAPKLTTVEKAKAQDRNKKGMFDHLNAVDSNYVLITGAGVAAQLVKTTTSPAWKDPSFITVSSWGGLLGLVRERIDDFMGPPIRDYFEKWYPVADDHNLDLMTRARMLYGMVRVYNLYYGTEIDYTRFISRLFHSVAPASPPPALALALGSRNVPIATTNYDMLQEACLDRFEYNLAEQFQYKGDVDELIETEMGLLSPSNYKHHIYHLHGVWHSRAELTLGIEYAGAADNFKNSMKVLTREYNNSDKLLTFVTRNDKNGQPVHSRTKPIVFIGTTSGVFDSHFLPWLLRNKQTHYILVRDAEFENIVATIASAKLTEYLVPVIYGSAYEDLAGFVNTLPQRNLD